MIRIRSVALVLAAWNLAAAASPALLDGLVEEAQRSNPEIAAAEQERRRLEALAPQVGTLPDPAIFLGYRDMDERETMYGMSQEFPFPGKLRLRREIAVREADRAARKYEAVRLAVTARLKEAYFDLCLARESAAVLERNRRLLVEFEATAKVLYGVGRGAQADVLRAQAEVSRVLARLAGRRQEEVSSMAELVRLLGRPAGQFPERTEALTLTPVGENLGELLGYLEVRAPLVQAARKDVERGDMALALAHREFFPDFEIAAQGLHSRPMDEDGYQVMLSVRVPLYFASRQREGVREAVADRERSVDELLAQRQELAARLGDAVARLERAEQVIGLLTGAIIPQARATLASANASYAVGRVDFLTLLNSLLTLQDNELEMLAETAEHEKAVALIEELVGELP